MPEGPKREEEEGAKRATDAEGWEGWKGGEREGGWRSDGVINDRVFNTLYGLAYKLRAVHRSSWQRINGRGADHCRRGMISLFSSASSTSQGCPCRFSPRRSDPSADRLCPRASYCFAGSPFPSSFSYPPPPSSHFVDRLDPTRAREEKLVNPADNERASLRRRDTRRDSDGPEFRPTSNYFILIDICTD